MVLDLMLGGDLRFLFDRTGPMKEHQVRFYVAEIGSALRHLNENSICHRDIKPDNILLDREGHAHLTDFNIAVKFNRDKPMKSIAGSLAYIAPEVLNGNGYIESEDWWSLGVVMYELLFGKRPFHGKHNDLLINSILNDPLTFPVDHDKTISKECVAFLQELLNRNISKRLGVGEINWLTFKQHEFMKMELEGEQPIDWKKLYNKQIKPPFTPDSSKANFDAGHELNEFINENKTLRIHGKGQIDYSMLPGGADGQIAKSLKLMEAKFTNYNFERKAEVLSSSPSNSTSNIDQPCIELEDTKQADTALAQTKT